MLNSSLPFTLIATSIGPVHLTISVSFVFFIFTFVNISTCPLEHPISVLLVCEIVTFVAVALWTTGTAPFSFTLFHTSFKLAHIACSVGPCILSFAFWFSIYIFSCVGIAINKDVGSSTVFQAHIPLAFIPVSIFPGMDSISMRLALVPFTNVTVIE